MTLAQFFPASVPVGALVPWPRWRVDDAGWRHACFLLAADTLALLGLWGEPGAVHLAVMNRARPADIAVLSLACPDGVFPSVGLSHAPAIRLERAVPELGGPRALGAEDARPWLDHFQGGDAPAEYRFLPVRGENLHEIPVGPVHAGIIEPGHFRFTAHGETVARLEQRLGYVHKGTLGLMRGAAIAHAARLAGRVSGDATLAYAWAFARAVEAASGTVPPPRALALRAVMAELERMANHFGDFGAICNDASFSLIHAHCGVLRERVLRAAHAAFGHRLMMDRIVPGGVAADMAGAGAGAIAALIGEVRRAFPELVRLYDRTASLQDRTVTTGIVKAEYAARFAAGGFVGRASGRDFDTRRDLAYPPYDALRFTVPVRTEGDVNARAWIRIEEVEQSCAIIEQLLAGLPGGETRVPVRDHDTGAEGMALVESFRGDVLAWVRLGGGGTVAQAFLRDPSWFQWPLLEVAIEGNIVADFPLCNKSFNCSYSGHDL
jgi:Ni,Fe-hydrogenase III large subunit